MECTGTYLISPYPIVLTELHSKMLALSHKNGLYIDTFAKAPSHSMGAAETAAVVECHRFIVGHLFHRRRIGATGAK